MPGLLRGIARTAAVAGTATAVSNRVSRRQAERWQAQEPQPEYMPPRAVATDPSLAQAPVAAAPAAAGPAPQDRVQQLKDLADLKAQGVLTDQEFAAEKARILGS
jgi:hypothetical protein